MLLMISYRSADNKMSIGFSSKHTMVFLRDAVSEIEGHSRNSEFCK